VQKVLARIMNVSALLQDFKQVRILRGRARKASGEGEIKEGNFINNLFLRQE
jgi:hypothetical protein